MPVIYQNFVSGTITDNPLLIGATTVNGSALADMVAVTGSNSMWLVLDPDGANGAPEIVSVTAHTASATSATIARAQQSTTAREHPAGTVFRVAATKSDLDELPFRKMTTTGDTLYASAANVAARLAIGASGLPYVSNGTIPGWTALGTTGLADAAVTSPKYAPTVLRLTRTGTLSDTLAAVSGWTETADASGFYPGSGSTITVPAGEAGRYAVASKFTEHASTTDGLSGRLYVNGVAVAVNGSGTFGGTIHSLSAVGHGVAVLHLADGDTVALYAACAAADTALSHVLTLELVRLA